MTVRSYQSRLEEACGLFGIEPRGSATPLSGGTANASFVVQAQETVIVTFCLSHTRRRAGQLAQLLRHFEQQHLETNRALPSLAGDCVQVVDGIPVLVKTYIAGTPVGAMTASRAEQLGALLARIHRVPVYAQLPADHAMAPETMVRLGRAAAHAEFSTWIEHALQRLDLDWSGLSRGIVHGDLFPDNLIERTDGRLVPIDFEEACLYPCVFDLGMALVGLANIHGLDPDHARQLLGGYRSAGALPQSELEYLPTMFETSAAMTACWRYELSRGEGPATGERRDWRDMRATYRLSQEWRAAGTWGEVLRA